MHEFVPLFTAVWLAEQRSCCGPYSRPISRSLLPISHSRHYFHYSDLMQLATFNAVFSSLILALHTSVFLKIRFCKQCAIHNHNRVTIIILVTGTSCNISKLWLHNFYRNIKFSTMHFTVIHSQ